MTLETNPEEKPKSDIELEEDIKPEDLDLMDNNSGEKRKEGPDDGDMLD